MFNICHKSLRRKGESVVHERMFEEIMAEDFTNLMKDKQGFKKLSEPKQDEHKESHNQTHHNQTA